MAKLAKPTVADRVMAWMRDEILSGAWRPGDKIPSENELSSQLGVSRVSVRAGIQKLSSLGLLESRQGEGTFVKDPKSARWNGLVPAILLSSPDLLELLEFRMMLEVECAALAAKHITASQLERLQKNLERMNAPDIAPAELSRVDIEFHLLIAEATGNQVVCQVYGVLKDVFIESLCRMSSITGTASGVRYHNALYQALQAHDSAAAAKLMGEHLTTVHASIEEGKPIE